MNNLKDDDENDDNTDSSNDREIPRVSSEGEITNASKLKTSFSLQDVISDENHFYSPDKNGHAIVGETLAKDEDRQSDHGQSFDSLVNADPLQYSHDYPRAVVSRILNFLLDSVKGNSEDDNHSNKNEEVASSPQSTQLSRRTSKAKAGQIPRLITLQAVSQLFVELVYHERKPVGKGATAAEQEKESCLCPSHTAYLQTICAEAAARMRECIEMQESLGSRNNRFLEMFAMERTRMNKILKYHAPGQKIEVCNVKNMAAKGVLLLPVSTGPSSGLPMEFRLPHGAVETTRKSIQVFLLLRFLLYKLTRPLQSDLLLSELDQLASGHTLPETDNDTSQDRNAKANSGRRKRSGSGSGWIASRKRSEEREREQNAYPVLNQLIDLNC